MECNVSTNPNVSRNYTEEERTCYLAHLQLYSTYTMIPAIIFLVVLCVVGIIGNSIVLFVYSQRFRSTASGTFIMAIAIFDLMANLMLIPGDIYSTFHYWDFDMVYLCKLLLFGHAVNHGASSLFLVALAVTRYRKICKPFSSQVSVKQARISCVFLTLIALVLSIAYFIIQGIQKKKTPNVNIIGYMCGVDDTFKGTALHKANTILFVVFFITVSSFLVVLYVKIWVKAKRHHNRKPSTCATRVLQQETKITNSTGVSCETKSSTSTNLDSIFVHAKGETKADENIKVHKPTSSLPKKFLEGRGRYRNAKVNSGFFTDPELVEHNNRNPDGITPHQRDRATKNKELSRSCEYVVGIQHTGISSTGQLNYPSKLKKSASEGKNFRSDLNPISFDKNETTRLQRSVTFSTFDIKENFCVENKRTKNKLTIGRQGSSRTTCMLVTISSIYISSVLPFMVLNGVKTAVPEFPDHTGFHVQSLYHFLFRSYLITTAINPIVYSFCDVKFRRACLTILRSLTSYR